MSQTTAANTNGSLDEATRQFLRCALDSELVQLDDVKKVVASLLAESVKLSPAVVVDGLVSAGMLTTWQAKKLSDGKHKGFFLGSYRLLRPLGRGGMGMVYLGEHHIMKRMMALKVLLSDSVNDKARTARFKDEARAAAQLDHPNIVQAYDCAEAAGKLYIVMEYIDGVNLQQAVARDGVMSIAAAVDAICQAADGLSHAHGRGIVHRDVKPSNLLLRQDGVLKVSDLGLARIGWTQQSQTEGSKRLTGTADFVAPEQAIDSKTVDARADIYSLGCTLFYLLAGTTPFDGQTIAQRLAKHQTSPIPNVRTIRAECPAGLAELVQRMMAKRPEDRIASMSDVLVQLKRWKGAVDSNGGRPLAVMIGEMDTSIDDSAQQSLTWDGSSFSGSEPSLEASSGSADDVDFSQLPDVLELPAAAAPANRLPRSAPAASPQKARSGSPVASEVHSANQQVLLGVGLTIASFALIVVMMMVVYNFQKPLEQAPPKLKISEDGKGTVVIVEN